MPESQPSPLSILLQAQGKFDLKEPYYRQLNPQAAAATAEWPQQQVQPCEHAGQALPHQQQGYMEHGQGSAEMQAAPGYAWANEHLSMQQQPGPSQLPQNGSRYLAAELFNQPQAYRHPWQ